MRRFLFLSLLGGGFLLSSLIVISCMDSRDGRDRAASANKVGELIYLEGDVDVNGKLASIGDLVGHSDVVVTPAGGLAEIKFGKRRVLRTEENTKLVIDNVNHVFNLQRGSMAVVQSRAGLFSRNKNWVVKTPTVAAAVRGTVYYTRVEDPDSTYFCLCNGKITLEGGDQKLDLEARNHNAVRFIKSADGVVNVATPMILHQDEDMERLAAKVGVEIDWTKVSK